MAHALQTAKIGSLVDVQKSDDPEGLKVFYYLIQDLKVSRRRWRGVWRGAKRGHELTKRVNGGDADFCVFVDQPALQDQAGRSLFRERGVAIARGQAQGVLTGPRWLRIADAVMKERPEGAMEDAQDNQSRLSLLGVPE